MECKTGKHKHTNVSALSITIFLLSHYPHCADALLADLQNSVPNHQLQGSHHQQQQQAAANGVQLIQQQQQQHQAQQQSSVPGYGSLRPKQSPQQSQVRFTKHTFMPERVVIIIVHFAPKHCAAPVPIAVPPAARLVRVARVQWIRWHRIHIAIGHATQLAAALADAPAGRQSVRTGLTAAGFEQRSVRLRFGQSVGWRQRFAGCRPCGDRSVPQWQRQSGTAERYDVPASIGGQSAG